MYKHIYIYMYTYIYREIYKSTKNNFNTCGGSAGRERSVASVEDTSAEKPI